MSREKDRRGVEKEREEWGKQGRKRGEEKRKFITKII